MPSVPYEPSNNCDQSQGSDPHIDPFHDMLCHSDPSFASQNKAAHNIQPVPFHVVNRPWQTICSFKWRKQQSVPVLDHRSGLNAIKHILRASANHGKKHLLLGDGMITTLCEDKGRSSNF